MNCIYLANVIIKKNDIKARAPIYSEAGRLRVMELLNILKASAFFKDIFVISQGKGKIRKRFRQSTSETSTCTVVYLPVIFLGKYWHKLSVIFLTIRWLLRNAKKEDLVISYNFDPAKAIPILLTKPFLKFRLLIQHEELLGDLGLKYAIHKFIEYIGSKTTNNFIVSSGSIKERLGLDSYNKRVVITSGYIPNYWKNSCSSEKNRNVKTLTCLYAGRLDEIRGIKKLIHTFKEINCQVQLIISGDGPLRSFVEDAANSSDKIIFLGMLSEENFNNIIKNVDVCINPQPTNLKFSNSSFPSKVINYLANGKIVITTKVKPLFDSPYKDMVIFYDDNREASLLESINFISANKTLLIKKAQSYCEFVEKIKAKEKNDISKMLKSFAGVSYHSS